MTAREKFRLDQRIRCNCNISHVQYPTGTVVGFGRMPNIVRIVRDGTRTPEAWHMKFVDVVGTEDAASTGTSGSLRSEAQK